VVHRDYEWFKEKMGFVDSSEIPTKVHKYTFGVEIKYKSISEISDYESFVIYLKSVPEQRKWI